MAKPRSTALVRTTSAHYEFERAALALIAAKRSEHTRAAYRADLQRWLAFCRSEDVVPEAPRLDATSLFRDHLTVNLSNESARRMIASMSSIYRLLLRGGMVRANPFHPAVLAWPQASALPKSTAVLDKDAQAMIRDAEADKLRVRGTRDAAILQILWDTGLRRMSVVQILRSHYRDGALRTRVKGDKEVELVLPRAAVIAIDRWLTVAPSSPFLFPGKNNASAICTALVNKIVKRRADAVGAKRIHPHSFRAAFVTAGYDAGLPERDIQESVHHADPKTTRRYDRNVRGRMVATTVETFRQRKGGR